MFRKRQKLGKYRIGRRIAVGGFAEVYEAMDTIEGVPVALKIPSQHLLTRDALSDFKREVRLTARLKHENILPIKNADFVGDVFVIAYPLGERSLDDRLQRRISREKALDIGAEILAGLAHAHAQRVIHCDVKPDNVVLFADGSAKLTDFGIARFALRTLRASGSGTVGYVAPEQAMGQPSFRSDVFSAGLLIYRMLTGVLPEWPYRWPLEGLERLRGRVSPDLIQVLHRALQVDPHKRYQDARQMLRALRAARASQERTEKGGTTTRESVRRDWREQQRKQFLREHGTALEARYACARCDGPVSEAMVACPWCGTKRDKHKDETRFPTACPRCRRGLKLDWKYCPWCYGGAVGPLSTRRYSDRRYSGACASCRHPLMPFMRYCPGCRAKLNRRWAIQGVKARCKGCGWGVLTEYWSTCPWCARTLKKPPARR
jgi:serine/threonine-protein kinase